MTPDQIAEIKERAYCPSAIQAVQHGEFERCARAIVERDAQALVAEVERLQVIESDLVQEIVKVTAFTAKQVGAAIREMLPILSLTQTAEVERLQAAVDAVRDVHRPHRECGSPATHTDIPCPECVEFCAPCGYMMPCPTIRALDEKLGGAE